MSIFPSTESALHATAYHPAALSSGIGAVWVNGQLVFENGKATGKRAGML